MCGGVGWGGCVGVVGVWGGGVLEVCMCVVCRCVVGVHVCGGWWWLGWGGVGGGGGWDVGRRGGVRNW